MKRVRYGFAGTAAVILAFSAPMVAQTQEVELSGNVTITSDYVFRGISQSDEAAAVQGGLDLSLPSSFYLGTWGSSIGFGRSVEVDAYGGFAPSVSGLDLDVGLIFYGYPGVDSDANFNFIELYGGVGRSFGPLGAELSAAYSPDYFGGSGAAFWGSVAASLGIPNTPISVDGSVGMQTIDDEAAFGAPDYMAWSGGVSVGVLGASLGLAVMGTDLSEDDGECDDICDTRLVFSISR